MAGAAIAAPGDPGGFVQGVAPVAFQEVACDSSWPVRRPCTRCSRTFVLSGWLVVFLALAAKFWRWE